MPQSVCRQCTFINLSFKHSSAQELQIAVLRLRDTQEYCLKPDRLIVTTLEILCIHVFFYKNFGSAPSTKSFLISHENFAIIVLKVS